MPEHMSAGAAPAPRGPSSGPRRWERILLVVSLGLNLLIAGVVVGGIATHERRPPKSPVGSVSIGPLTYGFNKEDLEALRRAVEEQGPALRDMRGALEADISRLVSTLRAEPWDQAAAGKVLADMRGRFEARGVLGERLILERIGAMSVQERLAVADRLERRGKRHGGEDGDDSAKR